LNVKEISQAHKDEAENYKKYGNDFMKIQDNDKAIDAYTMYVKILNYYIL